MVSSGVKQPPSGAVPGALKGEQIVSLIVRNAVDPAAIEDANPLEGEGAEGGLVRDRAGTHAQRRGPIRG
jgi:hypothetical protein